MAGRYVEKEIVKIEEDEDGILSHLHLSTYTGFLHSLCKHFLSLALLIISAISPAESSAAFS